MAQTCQGCKFESQPQSERHKDGIYCAKHHEHRKDIRCSFYQVFPFCDKRSNNSGIDL